MKNKFITSALPYVNNSPHLGNIVGCVLSADVYARFCRKIGYNVSFICGSDEYGTATEMKAFELQKTPREVCDQMVQVHESVYKWFAIEFDYFGRTSDPRHLENVQDVFSKLHAQGFFEEKSVLQFYCKYCQMFLSDRFVHGTCCRCKSSDARGDQCDGCGFLLKSTDLIDPKCSVCKNVPDMVNADHLFFRLGDFKSFLKSRTYDGWSKNAIEITNSWLNKDLKSRCMTRDLKFRWGVPVPLEKYKDKVFYVWFDAPIGYLSFLKIQRGTEYESFFNNCEWVQFMGKDNVSFHSIIFPAMLRGLEIACCGCEGGKEMVGIDNVKITPEVSLSGNSRVNPGVNSMKNNKVTSKVNNILTKENMDPEIIINATEYLMFENKKFSKSRKIGIFGEDLLDGKLGENSLWRYYLIKIRPETKDANFSFADFRLSVTELINTYGNLCNRVLKYIKKNGGKVLYKRYKIDGGDDEFISKINSLYCDYKEAMEIIELKSGIRLCLYACFVANQYLQKTFNKKAEIKNSDDSIVGGLNDKEFQFNCFSLTFSAVVLITQMFEPFIPTKSRDILKMIGVENERFPEEMVIFEEFELKNEIVQPFRNFTADEIEMMKKFEEKSE